MHKHRVIVALIAAGLTWTLAAPAQGEEEPAPAEESQMVTETLFDQTVAVEETPLQAPIASVEGRQNVLDPRMYDVVVTPAGSEARTISVYTAGHAQAPFNVELVDLGSVGATATMAARYTYDAAQATCLVALDGVCRGGLSFDPAQPGWLIGQPQVNWGCPCSPLPGGWELPHASSETASGTEAGLLIEVIAELVDGTIAAQNVFVPFVGQVAASAL